MRHLAPLAVVYLLVAALIVPASPFAAEDEAQQPAGEAVEAAEPTPEAAAPAAPPPPQPPPAPPEAPQPPPPAETQRAKPVARAAAPGSVTIKDFSFGPAAITVNVGESVTWTNSGPSAHTATANDGSFDTGLLSRGQSRSVTFRKAGSFAYICTPHPHMKGSVRVVAAESGSDAGTTTQDGDGEQGASAGSTGAGNAGSSAAGSAETGPSLPKSGAEAEALAVLGLLLLVLGASARRRVAG